MEITFKEFQEKPFEVKTNNRNIKRAIKLQLAVSKLDDTKNKGLTEISADTLAFFDSEKAFFADVLKLNKKQVDDFDDLDFQHTMEMLGELITKMMGNGQSDSTPEAKK